MGIEKNVGINAHISEEFFLKFWLNWICYKYKFDCKMPTINGLSVMVLRLKGCGGQGLGGGKGRCVFVLVLKYR